MARLDHDKRDLVNAPGHHVAAEWRRAQRPITIRGHTHQPSGAGCVDPLFDRARVLVAEQACDGQPP